MAQNPDDSSGNFFTEAPPRQAQPQQQQLPPSRLLNNHLESYLQTRVLQENARRLREEREQAQRDEHDGDKVEPLPSVDERNLIPRQQQQQQRPASATFGGRTSRNVTVAAAQQPLRETDGTEGGDDAVLVASPPPLPPQTSSSLRRWWQRVLATLCDERYWPFYVGIVAMLLTVAMLVVMRPPCVEDAHPMPFYRGRLRWRTILMWGAGAALGVWLSAYGFQHIARSVASS